MTSKKKKGGIKDPRDKWEIESMEIDHNTEKPVERSKILFDYYYDIITWKEKPVSERWLQQMCQEMVTAALNDPMMLTVTQFYHKRGFNSEDMSRWMEKYEFVKRAHQEVLTILGDKREVNGLFNKMNANMVMYSLPMFKKEWKHLAEWRAALKQEKEAAETKVVVIEKFADVEPEKKDED